MQAGELRTKITLQEKTEPTGIYDEPTYKDFKTVYCKWADLNSVEMMKNESLQGYIYAVLTLRSIDIDSTFRVIKNGHAWDILGYPKELENGRFIEIKVQRAVVG